MKFDVFSKESFPAQNISGLLFHKWLVFLILLLCFHLAAPNKHFLQNQCWVLIISLTLICSPIVENRISSALLQRSNRELEMDALHSHKRSLLLFAGHQYLQYIAVLKSRRAVLPQEFHSVKHSRKHQSLYEPIQAYSCRSQTSQCTIAGEDLMSLCVLMRMSYKQEWYLGWLQGEGLSW